MNTFLLWIITALLWIFYFYYLFACGKIYEGKIKNLVFLFLSVFLFGISLPLHQPVLGTATVLLLSFLFFYFYSELLIREFWWRLLLPGIFLTGGIFFLWHWKPTSSSFFLPVLTTMLFLYFALLSLLRGYLRKSNLILTGLLFAALSAASFFPSYFFSNHFSPDSNVPYFFSDKLSSRSIFSYFFSDKLSSSSILPYLFLDRPSSGSSFSLAWNVLLIFLSCLLFVLLEMNLRYYESGYRKTTKAMQEEIMQRQFGELRDIYLNMRGWRHDYHNHIQVLKAQLDSGQPNEARRYLNQIEHELDKVDTFIKSGNMMADAILNSKLTLAMQRHISITCEAYLPGELFLPDADLCTLLGNILDNAIEGCEKVAEEQRFLRIYLAMVKEQFYFSVQNSSVETGTSLKTDKKKQQYITTKRGNHGLGLKRVAAVVERFHGYLNLNQEEGVFGTEITIPKP